MELRQALTIMLPLLIIVLACSGSVGEDEANCCSQLGIPSECHFLCGVGKVGFWTTTRWKCTHKYYARIATCKVKNKIDYVKLFGQKFTQAVQDGFDKLSYDLKQKLMSAQEFVKVTVAELKQIPQDVLSSLQESLEGMTGWQFGNLVDRLVTFTSQNLKNLASHVNLKSFFDNVDKLVSKEWSLEQRSALMQAARRKFGENIQDWTKEALMTLKDLLTGLGSGDVAQIVGDAFKQGVHYICQLNFSKDQKTALMIPAQAAYGEVATWDEGVARKLCKLLEGLPVGEILKLASKTVANAIDIFAKNDFTVPQAKALIAKLKEEWKDIKSWSKEQLEDVGNLWRDFTVEDLKDLLQEQFKVVVKILGQLKVSFGKGRALVKKAIEAYGKPDQWSVDNLKELGNLTASLLPSEIRQIGSQVLKTSLKHIKNGDYGVDQARAIVEKVKNVTSVSRLTKDDLVALAKMIDGFLASDIGQMTQIVVFTAFPELSIAKRVGLPIVRAFIKKYEADQSGNKNIGMMGEYATGLSTVELDEVNVDSVISNLDQIGLISWDKAQVLKLAKKVRDRWGSFNGTEDDETDSPNWGFRNFKKLGKIVLGLAKEELGDLPIRGIEDTVEALGEQRGWDRGQVRMVLKRLREYWEMEELDFSNFTEVDVKALGSLLQGLAQEELKQLPEKVLLVAIKRLGEETGLPEDKLKARAYLAVEYIKNQTGTDLLNATHVADLGNLVSGLSKKALGKITEDAFVQNLYTIARSDGLTEDKLKEIAKLAKKHFHQSDVGKWIGEQWRDLGPAIVGLNPSDLRRISEKALDEVLDELAGLNFDVDQARALVAAAKEAWDQDDLGKWTGEQLRRLGSLVKGLDAADIRRISKEAFEEAVGAWGERMDIDVDTLKELAAKAVEHLGNGDASKLTAVVVKELGRVVLGLKSEDLDKLNLDNLDMVAALGQWDGWSAEQLKHLEPKVRDFLRQSGLDPDVYLSLGQLALSLNKDDIKKIGRRAFSLALKHLGELDAWSDEQCGALIDKAKTALGKTSGQWDKVDIAELGNVLQCLSTVDIPKLKTQVVDVLLPKVLKSMNVKQLQAFTPAQYEAMETPQLQAISSYKRSYLTAEQNDAVDAAIGRDPDEADPWGPDDEDGCPGNTCSGGGKQVPSVCLAWILPAGLLMYH